MGSIDDIKRVFNDQLNRHGYGFQYSVLRRAEELCTSKLSSWVFEACEFPVEVRGDGTRIDFILRPSRKQPYLLIAECKRADPKFSHWCFIKAPIVRRQETELFIADHIRWSPRGKEVGLEKLIAGPQDILGDVTPEAYHIARAVKNASAKGETNSSENDAIEKAASQVCRGINGFIETMQQHPKLFESGSQTAEGFYERTLIPVVFTTAQLYVSTYDLSLADIRTGKCDLSHADFRETDLLYFQYHLSPGIKHTARPEKEDTAIGSLLYNEYMRTIPIVSAKGIDSFLTHFKPWDKDRGPESRVASSFIT